MAKTIPFSQYFPIYHPEKGKPTYFVQKLWASLLGDAVLTSKETFLTLEERLYQLNKHLPYCIFQDFRDSILKTRTDFNTRHETFIPKGHTIRFGNRWKEGEMFSPRIWSGKPYSSKQIIIYDDIEIKKIWNFEMLPYPKPDEDQALLLLADQGAYNNFPALAKNDGLTEIQLLDWLKYPKAFGGQVLCWDEKINYSLIG